MKPTPEVFKRYEKKYLLTKSQFQQLYVYFQNYLTIDQYGKHTICNIYFDSPDYELIRTSLEKPVYKEKLRIRSYGTPQASDMVYLELKKKFDGIVYKRRVAMPLKDAVSYLYQQQRPNLSHQVIKEIDWVVNQYHLIPATYIAYDRIALYGNDNPNLRVTFDFNVRCRDSNLDLSKGDYGTPLMDEHQILMEVKIPGTMPMWMSQLFSDLKIFPTSYSKYGTYYKNYLYPKTTFTGGIHCA